MLSSATELLRHHEKLDEYEAAMLNNLNTDNPDEALVLIPSLSAPVWKWESDQVGGTMLVSVDIRNQQDGWTWQEDGDNAIASRVDPSTNETEEHTARKGPKFTEEELEILL